MSGKFNNLRLKLANVYSKLEYVPKLIDDVRVHELTCKDYISKNCLVADDVSSDECKLAIEASQLFSAVEHKSEVKKVVLQGAPGSGKTALSHSFAFNWSADCLFSGEFDFMFIQNLKLLNYNWKSGYSVEQLKNPVACHVHYDLETLCEAMEVDSNERMTFEEIESILKNENVKILFIVDGFGEVADQMRQATDQAVKSIYNSIFQENGKNSVLLLTRPNVLNRTEKNHFQRHAECVGLSTDRIHEYIRRYFQFQQELLLRTCHGYETVADLLAFYAQSRIKEHQQLYALLHSVFPVSQEWSAMSMLELLELQTQIAMHFKMLAEKLRFMMKSSPEIAQMMANPLHLSMLCLVLSDLLARDDHSWKELNVCQLHAEFVTWVSNNCCQRTGGSQEEEPVAEAKDISVLREVAFEMFMRQEHCITGAALQEFTQSQDTDVHTVYSLGLLSRAKAPQHTDAIKKRKQHSVSWKESVATTLSRNNSVDSTELDKSFTYSFLHSPVHEYLVAQSLFAKLTSSEEEPVYREATVYLAAHRYEMRFRNVLMFLVHMVHTMNVSNKCSFDQILMIQRFWECMLCAVDGVVELDLPAKITLIMHLLSYTKINNVYDARIPNVEKLVQMVEIMVVNDVAAFESSLLECGFRTDNLMSMMQPSLVTLNDSGKHKYNEKILATATDPHVLTLVRHCMACDEARSNNNRSHDTLTGLIRHSRAMTSSYDFTAASSGSSKRAWDVDDYHSDAHEDVFAALRILTHDRIAGGGAALLNEYHLLMLLCYPHWKVVSHAAAALMDLVQHRREELLTDEFVHCFIDHAIFRIMDENVKHIIRKLFNLIVSRCKCPKDAKAHYIQAGLAFRAGAHKFPTIPREWINEEFVVDVVRSGNSQILHQVGSLVPMMLKNPAVVDALLEVHTTLSAEILRNIAVATKSAEDWCAYFHAVKPWRDHILERDMEAFLQHAERNAEFYEVLLCFPHLVNAVEMDLDTIPEVLHLAYKILVAIYCPASTKSREVRAEILDAYQYSDCTAASLAVMVAAIHKPTILNQEIIRRFFNAPMSYSTISFDYCVDSFIGLVSEHNLILELFCDKNSWYFPIAVAAVVKKASGNVNSIIYERLMKYCNNAMDAKRYAEAIAGLKALCCLVPKLKNLAKMDVIGLISKCAQDCHTVKHAVDLLEIVCNNKVDMVLDALQQETNVLSHLPKIMQDAGMETVMIYRARLHLSSVQPELYKVTDIFLESQKGVMPAVSNLAYSHEAMVTYLLVPGISHDETVILSVIQCIDEIPLCREESMAMMLAQTCPKLFLVAQEYIISRIAVSNRMQLVCWLNFALIGIEHNKNAISNQLSSLRFDIDDIYCGLPTLFMLRLIARSVRLQMPLFTQNALTYVGNIVDADSLFAAPPSEVAALVVQILRDPRLYGTTSLLNRLAKAPQSTPIFVEMLLQAPQLMEEHYPSFITESIFTSSHWGVALLSMFDRNDPLLHRLSKNEYISDETLETAEASSAEWCAIVAAMMLRTGDTAYLSRIMDIPNGTMHGNDSNVIPCYVTEMIAAVQPSLLGVPQAMRFPQELFTVAHPLRLRTICRFAMRHSELITADLLGTILNDVLKYEDRDVLFIETFLVFVKTKLSTLLTTICSDHAKAICILFAGTENKKAVARISRRYSFVDMEDLWNRSSNPAIQHLIWDELVDLHCPDVDQLILRHPQWMNCFLITAKKKLTAAAAVATSAGATAVTGGMESESVIKLVTNWNFLRFSACWQEMYTTQPLLHQELVDTLLRDPTCYLQSDKHEIRQCCNEVLILLLSCKELQAKFNFLQLLTVLGYHNINNDEMKQLLTVVKKVLTARVQSARQSDIAHIVKHFEAVMTASSASKTYLLQLLEAVLHTGHISAVSKQFVFCMMRLCNVPLSFTIHDEIVFEGHVYPQHDTDSKRAVEEILQEALSAGTMLGANHKHDIMINQYVNGDVLFKNSNIGLPLSAAEMMVPSLLSPEVMLQYGTWHVSELTTKDRKGYEIYNRLLLETRNAFGELVVIRVLQQEEAVESKIFAAVVHPTDLPRRSRELRLELFGMFELLSNHDFFLRCTKHCDEEGILLSKLSLVEYRSLPEELSKRLNARLLSVAYAEISLATILELDEVERHALTAMPRLERRASSFVERRVISVESTLQAMGLSILESPPQGERNHRLEVELQEINKDAYKVAFYHALRWYLTAVYVSSCAVKTDRIVHDRPVMDSYGQVWSTAGHITPLIGLGAVPVGQVLLHDDDTVHRQFLSKYLALALDAQDMNRSAEEVARKLALRLGLLHVPLDRGEVNVEAFIDTLQLPEATAEIARAEGLRGLASKIFTVLKNNAMQSASTAELLQNGHSTPALRQYFSPQEGVDMRRINAGEEHAMVVTKFLLKEILKEEMATTTNRQLKVKHLVHLVEQHLKTRVPVRFLSERGAPACSYDEDEATVTATFEEHSKPEPALKKKAISIKKLTTTPTSMSRRGMSKKLVLPDSIDPARLEFAETIVQECRVKTDAGVHGILVEAVADLIQLMEPVYKDELPEEVLESEEDGVRVLTHWLISQKIIEITTNNRRLMIHHEVARNLVKEHNAKLIPASYGRCECCIMS